MSDSQIEVRPVSSPVKAAEVDPLPPVGPANQPPAPLEGTLSEWLDKVPFSRPRKNFGRDFADGVLTAEAIHHYIPHLVEVHNYNKASSLKQKQVNWNLLNRKVLTKLNYKLLDNQILQLAEGKQVVIEQVLGEIRAKIAKLPPTGIPRPVSRGLGVLGGAKAKEEPAVDELFVRIHAPIPEESKHEDEHLVANVGSLNALKTDLNLKACGYTGQITNKNVPLLAYDLVQKDNNKLVAINKDLLERVVQLETVIGLKDQRLYHLQEQYVSLRNRRDAKKSESEFPTLSKIREQLAKYI